MDSLTTLSSIKQELEAQWKLFDDAFGALDDRGWARKFGKTWTYADIPYHLAYFDRMVARSVREAASAPANRLIVRSMGEMNDWNRQELSRRKPGHTVQDSLAEMRQSREELRRLLGGMTDADLDRKAWMPLIFGWVTTRDVLQANVIHNVAEYWKLWIRTGQRGPAPNPAAVHLRLNFMMSFLPRTLNRELAKTTPFTLVWNFTGPGGGQWTFRVRDGACTVKEESPAEKPDLMITMTPVAFHKLVAKMTPPPWLMLTGQMKIKGFGAMGKFSKLFPEPKPDQIMDIG